MSLRPPDKSGGSNLGREAIQAIVLSFEMGGDIAEVLHSDSCSALLFGNNWVIICVAKSRRSEAKSFLKVSGTQYFLP